MLAFVLGNFILLATIESKLLVLSFVRQRLGIMTHMFTIILKLLIRFSI